MAIYHKLYKTSLAKIVGKLFILILFTECGSEVNQSQKVENKSPLFKLVPLSISQINFVNKLPESRNMNSFVYEYYYNGGGVAVGDVNNDGFDDIYFTSNLSENRLYQNKGGLKFENISKKAGVIGNDGWTTGATMVDINADGWLDIYVSKSGRFIQDDMRRNELFINQGIAKNGVIRFEEQAANYGLDDPSCGTQASFFDFDRDGDLDVFLANHNIESPPIDIQAITDLRSEKSEFGGNKLFRNDSGKFIDVSNSAGIESHLMNYTLGISVGDVNNDLWPDIYVAIDYGEPDILYINNKDGTFENVIKKSFGHIPLASMGSDIGDINNDGLLDIMTLDMAGIDHYSDMTSISGLKQKQHDLYLQNGLLNQYSYNSLQLNNGLDQDGIPLFSDIAHFSGMAKTDWSWSPLIADFDNDGLNDIFISNGVYRDFINIDYNLFLQSEMDKVIAEKKNPLDFYEKWTKQSPQRSVSNYLFRNEGNLKFTNESQDWDLSKLSNSNGTAYADFDNDGDLDLVMNNFNAQASLYENKSDEVVNQNYLAVELIGSALNLNGIGAKLILKAGGQTMVREQYLTRGFQSSISTKIHFGMGAISAVDSLTVLWPSGKIQTLTGIKSNNLIRIEEVNASIEESDNYLINKYHYAKNRSKLDFIHQENDYDDFADQVMLPYKYSQLGPTVAVGDVNNDGLEDIFIGGAKDQSGAILLQKSGGKFARSNNLNIRADRGHEDVASKLFDADNDGDLDLYVVSGGNEESPESDYYLDRFYENVDGDFVNRKKAIPEIPFSGSCVVPGDYDNDGDLDLFVGGRIFPGKYPMAADSYLLRNDSEPGNIRYTNVTSEVNPDLEEAGLVTDAAWVDMNNDQKLDLVVVGEWMPVRIFKNVHHSFEEVTNSSGLSEDIGWWRCIEVHDFDNDGDEDFVVGNIGQNFRHNIDKLHPLEIFAGDFDRNGTFDIAFGYYQNDQLFPLRGKGESGIQTPFVNHRFKTHHEFSSATLFDIYGAENLEKSTHLKATNFASSYIENLGDGKFEITPLDNLAQLSSTNSIEVVDLDEDGYQDIILTGNLYYTESKTTRHDASFGLYLKGDGTGNFKANQKGNCLQIIGEIRDTELINISGGKALLVARNNGSTELVILKTSE